MKKILYSILVILMVSCNKEIVPGNYSVSQSIPDTTKWESQYSNGGTLPN